MRKFTRTIAGPIAAGLMLAGCADPIFQDAVSDAVKGVRDVASVDYAKMFAGEDPVAAEQSLVGSLHGDAVRQITPHDREHMLRSAAYALQNLHAGEQTRWQSPVTGHQGWTRVEATPTSACRMLWVSFQDGRGHTARGRTRACQLADGSWRMAGRDPGAYPEPYDR